MSTSDIVEIYGFSQQRRFTVPAIRFRVRSCSYRHVAVIDTWFNQIHQIPGFFIISLPIFFSF
jgi:hypothetical protein